MPERRRDDEYDDFEDDRPRRRPRDDDRDEPRARRPRDDRDYDDYDRPRRRARSQEEEDYDDEPERRRGRFQPQKLRAIAMRQKVIIFCIIAYLAVVAARFIVPPEVRLFLAVVGLIVSLTAAVFVLMLAIEVHGTGLGIVFGILALIPCVGLIILLIVNQQATSLLQRNGIRVGLLGANISDVP
jgi:hypothetical protein